MMCPGERDVGRKEKEEKNASDLPFHEKKSDFFSLFFGCFEFTYSSLSW